MNFIIIIPGLFSGCLSLSVLAIYEVNFISQNGNLQLALKETTDTVPQTDETVLVKAGTNYKGKIFY